MYVETSAKISPGRGNWKRNRKRIGTLKRIEMNGKTRGSCLQTETWSQSVLSHRAWLDARDHAQGTCSPGRQSHSHSMVPSAKDRDFVWCRARSHCQLVAASLRKTVSLYHRSIRASQFALLTEPSIRSPSLRWRNRWIYATLSTGRVVPFHNLVASSHGLGRAPTSRCTYTCRMERLILWPVPPAAQAVAEQLLSNAGQPTDRGWSRCCVPSLPGCRGEASATASQLQQR